MAQSGNIKRASKLTEKLKADIEKSGMGKHAYWYAEATLAANQGNYEEAILYFKKSQGQQNMFSTGYRLAEIYLQIDQPANAISELERLSNSYSLDRAYNYTTWSTKLHYYLGLAYEQTGQYKKAKEQYTVFLDIWKNADEGIDEIEDAKKRLTRLQNNS